MVFEALKILKDEFGRYVEQSEKSDISSSDVVLDNVSNIEGNNSPINLKDKVIISLVNLEEESTLKNIQAYQRSQDGIRYSNPAVNVNLYILFCANFPEGMEAYEKALRQISLVVKFFQGNNVFTLQNALNTTVSADPDNPDLSNLKLILDMYTLTFEQINHLWGSLGGKQIPFVMYKARLVKIRDRKVRKGGEIIREVQSAEEIQ